MNAMVALHAAIGKVRKPHKPKSNVIVRGNQVSVIIYVLCHDGNESQADEFCFNMNTKVECLYKKHKLKQSKYFENEFYFWWTNNSDKELLPSVKWIGLIVPHYTTKVSPVNFYDISKNMGDRDYYGLKTCDNDCVTCHPGGLNLLNETLKKVGLITSTITNFRCTYCNYWLMSVNALNDYSNYVLKIYNIWDGEFKDNELSNLMNGNSMYPLRAMTSEKLLLKTGFTYYTFHPFLLERMNKLILTSLGYLCDVKREYNPNMIVVKSTVFCSEELDVTELISNKIHSKLSFKVNSSLLPDRTLKFDNLLITYCLKGILKTINIPSKTVMVPVFV